MLGPFECDWYLVRADGGVCGVCPLLKLMMRDETRLELAAGHEVEGFGFPRGGVVAVVGAPLEELDPLGATLKGSH